MMIRELVVTLSFLSMPAAAAVIFGSAAAPLFERPPADRPMISAPGADADAYAMTCAVCHGPSGEGTRAAPPLVGPGGLAPGFDRPTALARMKAAHGDWVSLPDRATVHAALAVLHRLNERADPSAR
ncbi:MAG: c-type cytochrome [Pikeienuella sp.]